MKRILLLFMILSFKIFSFTFYPLNFDKRLDSDNAYQEFFIKNDSKSTLKYQLTPMSTGKDRDISQYVKIYPKVITIDPLSVGSFKVFVEDNEKIPYGQSSFLLGIKTLKVPQLQQVGEKENNSSVDFKLALNLEMFAYKGEVGQEFQILESEFYKKEDGKYWKGKIRNENGRGYEIAVGFIDRTEAIFGLENLGRLFHGSNAEIDVKIPEGAKYIVFWDHNNTTLVGQKIKIK